MSSIGKFKSLENFIPIKELIDLESSNTNSLDLNDKTNLINEFLYKKKDKLKSKSLRIRKIFIT